MLTPPPSFVKHKILLATAFNFAGKAVVAVVLGFKPEILTLTPDDPNNWGRVRVILGLENIDISSARLIPDSKEKVENAIRFLVSGLLSMIRHENLDEEEADYEDEWEAIYEDEDFQTLLSGISLSGTEKESFAYIKLLECQTESLLQENWAKVEAVAEALFQRRELIGDEILAAIEGRLDESTAPLSDA